MNVGGGVGHRRRAHRESVTAIMSRGERVHGTIVARGRLRPGHSSGACTSVGRLRDVGRGARDGGILIVRHRDVERCGGRVGGIVGRRVGHRGRTHCKGIARAVGGGHRGSTVVRVGGLRPGHDSRTHARIVGLRDVRWGAGDRGGIVVGHSHREGGRSRIARSIRGGVDHRRGARPEAGAAAVVGSETGHSTVVSRRRLRPRSHR